MSHSGERCFRFVSFNGTQYLRTQYLPHVDGDAEIKTFVLNFDGENATGLTPNASAVGEGNAGAWYDMSGRRLTSKPTQTGLYLNDGRKVVVE